MKVKSDPKPQSSIVLRLRQVMAKTGLARSTVYDLIKRDQFPNSIKLGAKIVGWLESDIESWIAEQVRNSRGGVQ